MMAIANTTQERHTTGQRPKRLLKNPYVIMLTITILVATGGYFYNSHRAAHASKAKKEAEQKGDYVRSITSFAQFASIQGAPLSDKLNNVWSVKLVYDIHDQALYYVNSVRYRYHYDFCRQVLGNDIPLELYNTMNYGNTLQKQYVLANLNYYRDGKIYAIEFSSEDRTVERLMLQLVSEVKKTASMGDSVKLLVNSDRLQDLSKANKLNVPKAFPADIYKTQQYQSLNGGIAYGILKQVTGEDDYTGITEKDIVLMRGTPVNVPVCAGIITNSFQTPLSHINVLCHNRNIPAAAHIQLYNDNNVAAYMGKPVRLEVGPTQFTVGPATQASVDSFYASRTTTKVISLHFENTSRDLLPIDQCGLKQKNIIGNKAAGLGELNKIAKKSSAFSIPEGAFAIPFYYYTQHVSTPRVKAQLDILRQIDRDKADEATIKKQLKLVREAIKAQPLDPVLLASVTTKIKAGNASAPYRFRSSSNAEDAAGFSAAGLYDSKTGKLDDKNKPVDVAIKKVWASTFSEAAYRERRSAHIDENTIMMGILVHRGFPNEFANGVPITKNLYRNGFPGYTINVQAGDISVVSPPDSVVCDQFVIMRANNVDPLNSDITVDYITNSNINNGKPVLSKPQSTQLFKALEAVQAHYYRLRDDKMTSKDEVSLDIEFKFDRNGKLYLKQVRPYR